MSIKMTVQLKGREVVIENDRIKTYNAYALAFEWLCDNAQTLNALELGKHVKLTTSDTARTLFFLDSNLARQCYFYIEHNL